MGTWTNPILGYVKALSSLECLMNSLVLNIVAYKDIFIGLISLATN